MGFAGHLVLESGTGQHDECYVKVASWGRAKGEDPLPHPAGHALFHAHSEA